MSKISMVENAKATACKSVGTRNFVEAVISGKWRDKIKTIRRTYQMTMEQTGGDSKRASAAISELKRKLPAVIWAGEFSKRESKGVKEYSGLMVIALDHLGTMLTKAKKNYLLTLMCSPVSSRRRGMASRLCIKFRLILNAMRTLGQLQPRECSR